MNLSTPAVKRLIPTLLGLLLLAVCSGAWSQQPAQPDPAPASAPDREKSATATDEQAAQETPPPTAPVTETSPFDYQASEEISQDLSVSFPVDI
jgi:hypothetical protein